MRESTKQKQRHRSPRLGSISFTTDRRSRSQSGRKSRATEDPKPTRWRQYGDFQNTRAPNAEVATRGTQSISLLQNKTQPCSRLRAMRRRMRRLLPQNGSRGRLRRRNNLQRMARQIQPPLENTNHFRGWRAHHAPNKPRGMESKRWHHLLHGGECHL